MTRSVLSFLVLGQVIFLGSVFSPPLIGFCSSTQVSNNTNQLSSETDPCRGYTCTPGIGAHKIHNHGKSWLEARIICRNENAALTTINSEAEVNLITDLWNQSLPLIDVAHQDWIHIGFHDLYAEGQYTTVSNMSLAAVGFYEWSEGEPNNGEGGNRGENCGSLDHNGFLNDIDCEQLAGFMCEKTCARLQKDC